MPVTTGTVVSLYPAVSQARILLRVLTERPDAPPYPVGFNVLRKAKIVGELPIEFGGIRAGAE